MNPELTQRLFDDFPHLYRGRYLPHTHTLMSFGFECEDGWFDILYSLSQGMQAYCEQHPEAADLMVVQVKEKFGGLRVYTQPRIAAIEALIQAAAARARQTCEQTGQPGVLCQRQGYCQTLSLEVAQELGFEPVTPLPASREVGQ